MSAEIILLLSGICPQSSKVDMMFSDDDKKIMLNAAREVLTVCVKGEEVKMPESLSKLESEAMGIFVTLHTRKGELRGCIGYLEGIKPLRDAIMDMTIAAATEDPRFKPVSEEELGDVMLEISLLSPLRKIESPDELEIGKHGLVISRGHNKGLLLPQVATENNWDRKTFIEHTCEKARLPRDAWKLDDTEISIFSAEVFEENYD